MAENNNDRVPGDVVEKGLPKDLGIPNDGVIYPERQPKAIAYILKTIRTIESGENYQITNKTSTASGAYQFLDSSWKALAANVPNANQYARAYLAPPSVQDAVAEYRVRQILGSSSNQLSSVPINWYYPAAWTNTQLLDFTPPGNKISIRGYAEKWLAKFREIVESDKDSTGIIDGITSDIVSGVIPVVEGATEIWDTATAVPRFLGKLMEVNTWVRVAKVIGGVVVIFVGIQTITGTEIAGGFARAKGILPPKKAKVATTPAVKAAAETVKPEPIKAPAKAPVVKDATKTVKGGVNAATA